MKNKIKLLIVTVFLSRGLMAESLVGNYEVSLTNGIKQIKVADLELIASGEGTHSYQLDMLTENPFQDFFLSMRPFRCLSNRATDIDWCHLVYPYDNRHYISKTDLTDLEYDLLFIRRKSTDYGINSWFGSYYRLQWQGDEIHGELFEVDLNILTVPPEKGNLRPIVESDLYEAQKEKFWLPALLIKKKLIKK